MIRTVHFCAIVRNVIKLTC